MPSRRDIWVVFHLLWFQETLQQITLHILHVHEYIRGVNALPQIAASAQKSPQPVCIYNLTDIPKSPSTDVVPFSSPASHTGLFPHGFVNRVCYHTLGIFPSMRGENKIISL